MSEVPMQGRGSKVNNGGAYRHDKNRVCFFALLRGRGVIPGPFKMGLWDVLLEASLLALAPILDDPVGYARVPVPHCFCTLDRTTRSAACFPTGAGPP